MLDFTKPVLLHNNSHKPFHRQYEMVFEEENQYTTDISNAAYEKLQFKLDLNFRHLDNPYFEVYYLFSTITPEKFIIRYFFVEFRETLNGYAKYFIVEDLQYGDEAIAEAYKRNHPDIQYSPLNERFFVDLHINLDSCLRFFLENCYNKYPDFQSMFLAENFEDEITQYVLLGY